MTPTAGFDWQYDSVLSNCLSIDGGFGTEHMVDIASDTQNASDAVVSISDPTIVNRVRSEATKIVCANNGVDKYICPSSIESGIVDESTIDGTIITNQSGASDVIKIVWQKSNEDAMSTQNPDQYACPASIESGIDH